MSSKAHYQDHELGKNNIWEIEANPANGYSGAEPYFNGRTDFRRAYKIISDTEDHFHNHSRY